MASLLLRFVTWRDFNKRNVVVVIVAFVGKNQVVWLRSYVQAILSESPKYRLYYLW